MNDIRMRIFVTGRVQGVFFRANTVKEAERIDGLTGWVKNLPDGRVEVLCQGEKAKVDELVGWLHHGPPMAQVNKVEAQKEAPGGDLGPFTVAW